MSDRLLRFGLTTICAFAVLLMASFGTYAQASSRCPDNMSSYGTMGPGETLVCSCSATLVATGSVWGTNRYSMDSAVCRAALHAGAVTTAGGEITVYRAAGCPSFQGSTRNGVATSDWGALERSFAFAWPAPACPAAPAGKVEACPTTMQAFVGMPAGQVLKCTCGPAQLGGTVWGTLRYTADSSTCGAALHAGAIAASGGEVTLYTSEGCQSFPGTVANGITSQSWGVFERSFSFVNPAPACAQ